MTQAQKPVPRLLTLYAVTFLHPGTGQSTGVVDLPVQREVHTGHPMFASSGLKGALRDKAEQCAGLNKNEITTIFGGESDNPAAGALTVTDARILAFPVRSLQKVFVWVTCPMVVRRLKRDAELIGYTVNDLPDPGEGPPEGTAWVADDGAWNDPLVLEEIALDIKQKDQKDQKDKVDKYATFIAAAIGTKPGFDQDRLVILNDADFRHFVEHATQISARIKLNEQKTTGAGGNLWYEETLPPETILYALTLCHKPRKQNSQGSDNTGAASDDSKAEPAGQNGTLSADDVATKLGDLLKDGFLQIGGNETVGQGWCHVNLPEGNS